MLVVLAQLVEVGYVHPHASPLEHGGTAHEGDADVLVHPVRPFLLNTGQEGGHQGLHYVHVGAAVYPQLVVV